MLKTINSRYNPKKIEKKWQRQWEEQKLYRADDKSQKPKYYQLETFPYPSAAGLHMGTPKGYTAEDIHARYMRMKGHEVLYTIGWDAFGLPTENYAIKVGKSPKKVAEENIKNFKRQVRMFGFSYDWDREINTSSPEYYKWTQWLFIQLFNKGLAYRKKANVNWCSQDKTVIANEQVVDGCCERCGEKIIQKELDQWFLKITDYTERLIEDLKGLDWPEATVKRQLDWIGKSEGAAIKFSIFNFKFSIEVFTTRPDTVFGATYMVLAPEHKSIQGFKSQIKNWDEVARYVNDAGHKTELMRQTEINDKTGVELKGIKAINPATNKEIPVWIADYVLSGYGTGAIMAVPAHDQRDYEFAKKFNLPIKKVITEEGELINSGKFNGMHSEKARWEITKFVNGERKIQYKLRDWSVSRQRYWGVPIPVIHCDNCSIVPVPEEDLPVVLPELKNYRPEGVSPLASSEKFINVKCPKCKSPAQRDPETLDTFVDSSWYYLAYAGMKNSEFRIQNSDLINYWMPVDLYVIGAEHTVLHLLYSRFISKFLYDEGYLKFKEPFLKLRHVGLLLGNDGQKMSKSKGNVVNPDEVVEQYGADTVRMYEMFMGPFEDSQPWDSIGIIGVYRFLNRTWNLFNKVKTRPTESSGRTRPTESSGRTATQNSKVNDTSIKLNRTIKKIGEDIEKLSFNTCVSELMKLLNEFERQGHLSIVNCQMFLKLLAPFAPHMAEELWCEVLGNKTSIHLESWPAYDENLLVDDTVNMPIQVNGKLRDVISVSKGISEEDIREKVLSSPKVEKNIGNKEIKKFIYIKDKAVNIVTG